MDIFMMRDEAPGFPFFLPNGMILKNTLLDYWREIHKKAGYVEISTPMIMNKQLWQTSGHWDHYKDNMYSTVIDEEEYCVKPMNCPGGVLVYASKPHSYRDLPIRAGEIGLVHRHEMKGALHGLFRVRCFNQDDAHLFVRPDQLTEEIVGVVKLIDSVYQQFGFTYHVELSTRPEDSMGSDEDWEAAEAGLKTALEELGMEYEVKMCIRDSTTAASHNSVLRPLFRARDMRGAQVEVARILPDGSLDWESYERALEGGANLVAATHASNVTGDVHDVVRMAAMAHDAGALFVLDAAQTVGAMPVDMAALGVDVLCFTGHKSLYGPQGTGGLIVREGLEICLLYTSRCV